MHKKSVFFGMGIGMVCMVLIAFAAYTVQRAANANEADFLTAYDPNYEAEDAGEDTFELDHDFIVALAREMGMVFLDEVYFPDPPQPEPEPELEPDPPQPEPEPEPTPEPEPDMRILRRFTIPVGANATQFARVLEEADVIDSAEEFLEFLQVHDYAHLIRAGTFHLYTGSDFWEIVDAVVHGN